MNLSHLAKLAVGWKRNAVLVAAIILAVASFVGLWRIHRLREQAMPGIVKNPPWLMWGNSQIVKVPLIVGQAQSVGQQLVKIAYGRPESWRFLFYVRVIDVPLNAPTDHPITQLTVDFNLDTGIGRATAKLDKLPNSLNQPGFERYIFAGNPLNPQAANAFKWSTSVYGPLRDDVHANPPSNFTDVIVGQDIQLNVVVTSTCSMDEPALSLEIGAFFAPNVHIRPEWFKGKMGQEEDQGR
jgi:hypothetical protein